jgi:hypothetical protein
MAGKRDEVLLQIEEAFGGVPYPGDERLLYPGGVDDYDIACLRGFRDWRAIPEDVVSSAYAAPSFLSPAAFRFFLPAFMRFVLRNYESRNSVCVDATIYALCPLMRRGQALYRYSESQYTELDCGQRKAVVSFLAFMAGVGERFVDVRAALRALRYWQAVIALKEGKPLRVTS